MSIPMSAPEVLDREFLELRAKLLQLAASFDRLDRAEESVKDDPRYDLILRGLKLLQEEAPNRAEKFQLLFSREYEDNWRSQYGI